MSLLVVVDVGKLIVNDPGFLSGVISLTRKYGGVFTVKTRDNAEYEFKLERVSVETGGRIRYNTEYYHLDDWMNPKSITEITFNVTGGKGGGFKLVIKRQGGSFSTVSIAPAGATSNGVLVELVNALIDKIHSLKRGDS